MHMYAHAIIYVNSHGIRFTPNDFSAPCHLCANCAGFQTNAGRTESPKFAIPNRTDLAPGRDQTLLGAWAL